MPPKTKKAAPPPKKQKQKQKQTTRVVVNVNSNNKRKTTSSATSKSAQMPLVISSVMPAVAPNPTPAPDVNRAAEMAQLRHEMQQGLNYTLAQIQAQQQPRVRQANVEAQTEAITANDAGTDAPFIQTASIGTGEQTGILSAGTSPIKPSVATSGTSTMKEVGQKRQRALRTPEKPESARPKIRSASTNTAQTFRTPVMRTPKPEPMDISPIPPHPRSAVRKLMNAFEEKAGYQKMSLQKAAKVPLPGSSVSNSSSASSIRGYETSGVSSNAPTEYLALQKLSRFHGDLTNAKGKKLNQIMYDKASKPEYVKLEFNGKPMGELLAKKQPMNIAAAIGIHKKVYTMDDYNKLKPTIEEYYGYKKKPIPDVFKASTSGRVTRSKAKKE
jgi:hypothetical protein